MKSNEELQQNVEDALKWEPSLHAAEIGVTVKGGIVTLTGVVDNYSKKMEAEHAAKSVSGVKAVVEKISVELPELHKKSDDNIAAAAIKALQNSWSVPDDKIKIKIENGWIYLDGILNWNYQREEVKRIIHGITGVKGIINNIIIKGDVHDKLEESLIRDALKRHWSLKDDDIKVRVAGTTVTLIGFVSSLYKWEQAERIAWKTPGISDVVNNLQIVENEHVLSN